MQEIQIWHNPKCSKSRAAMELLENKNIDASVVKYLEQTPTKEQLKDVLSKLKISAKELLRTGEDVYKELNLKGATRSDFILRGEELFFLEVNTSPGMTETSLLPKIATLKNIDFDTLVEKIVCSVEK